MFPSIKLYAKLSISGRARTLQECYDNFNKLKVEYKITTANDWEQKIIEKPKNIHLKFAWECSFYENKTLEEIKEDKKVRL